MNDPSVHSINIMFNFPFVDFGSFYDYRRLNLKAQSHYNKKFRIKGSYLQFIKASFIKFIEVQSQAENETFVIFSQV